LSFDVRLKAHDKIILSAFETWWHTVMYGRGSEGETGEWSG